MYEFICCFGLYRLSYGIVVEPGASISSSLMPMLNFACYVSLGLLFLITDINNVAIIMIVNKGLKGKL